jgi:hypothetical protein
MSGVFIEFEEKVAVEAKLPLIEFPMSPEELHREDRPTKELGEIVRTLRPIQQRRASLFVASIAKDCLGLGDDDIEKYLRPAESQVSAPQPTFLLERMSWQSELEPREASHRMDLDIGTEEDMRDLWDWMRRRRLIECMTYGSHPDPFAAVTGGLVCLSYAYENDTSRREELLESCAYQLSRLAVEN